MFKCLHLHGGVCFREFFHVVYVILVATNCLHKYIACMLEGSPQDFTHVISRQTHFGPESHSREPLILGMPAGTHEDFDHTPFRIYALTPFCNDVIENGGRFGDFQVAWARVRAKSIWPWWTRRVAWDVFRNCTLRGRYNMGW